MWIGPEIKEMSAINHDLKKIVIIIIICTSTVRLVPALHLNVKVFDNVIISCGAGGNTQERERTIFERLFQKEN